MKKFLLFSVAFALFGFLKVEDVFANNVRITAAPQLVDRGGSGGARTAFIQFPLRWENSWRSNRPSNFDAVWVFAKAWDGTVWRHVYLHCDSLRHNFGPGTGAALHQNISAACNIGFGAGIGQMVIEPGRSQVQFRDFGNWETGTVGVFIYRRAIGRGTVDLRTVRLFWDYGRQGFFEDDSIAIKVFAIEMVYIPEGPFWLGAAGTDATREGNSFTAGTATGVPFRVTSEDAIAFSTTLNATATTLGLGGGTGLAGNVTSIPAAFPKGFQSFFIMKYDLTQAGWAAFLNTLTTEQVRAHTGLRTGTALSATNIQNVTVGHSPFNNVNHGTAMRGHRQHLVLMARGDRMVFGVNAAGGNPGVANVATLGRVATSTRAGQTFATGVADTRTTDGQDLAMNHVSWFNLLAFAEWSGLRPMTCMEFEKAARGPIPSVPQEFAWGSSVLEVGNINNGVGIWASTVTRTAGHLDVTPNTARVSPTAANFNTGDENFPPLFQAVAWHSTLTEAAALANATQANRGGSLNRTRIRVFRPAWRVGAFAEAATTRQSSGASYWGVMNMSDNVNIMVINSTRSEAHQPTAGNPFVGAHGTGVMLGDGSSNLVRNGWPTNANAFFAKGMTMDRTVVAVDFPPVWVGANTTGSMTVANRDNLNARTTTVWNNAVVRATTGAATGALGALTWHWNTGEVGAQPATASTQIAIRGGGPANVNWDRARISDRSASAIVVDQFHNHPQEIDPGIRLVRTRGVTR